MSFVENLKKYLEYFHIKIDYLSLITDISMKRIKEILNTGEITEEEIEEVVDSLGKDKKFFENIEEIIQEDIRQKEEKDKQFASLSDKDKRLVGNLTDMIRFYDAIVNLEL